MYTRNRSRLWIGAMLAGLLAAYVALDSRLATGEDTYDKVGKGLEAFGKAYELLTTETGPMELDLTADSGKMPAMIFSISTKRISRPSMLTEPVKVWA